MGDIWLDIPARLIEDIESSRSRCARLRAELVTRSKEIREMEELGRIFFLIPRKVSNKTGASSSDSVLELEKFRSKAASEIPFSVPHCHVEQLPCFLSMFQVIVVSASGRSESISLPESSKVGDLKILAQKSFQQGFLRLVTAEGRILVDFSQSLVDAQLEDKDCLTAVAQQATLAATKQIRFGCGAFALWCCGGSRIVTWGLPHCGGDSAAVQGQLKNVQQVQGTDEAFAAILADGSVQGTDEAFAAILADGSVVSWGQPDCGGDSSAVQGQLKNVQQVQGTSDAFAAILADGSVVTWGDPHSGGDSSAVQGQLKNVQKVQGTGRAFAAILADGYVVTWGDPHSGGDSSAVQGQLKNVQQVQGTDEAFAAILADGSVVSWGQLDCGGDSSAVQGQLKNVQQVQGTSQLKNVQQVQGTSGAFAAILADGSVVTWGDPHGGGDSSAVQGQLKNVQQVQGTSGAFAAILADGSVVTWGHPHGGGDSSAVQGQLKNVQKVQGTGRAFAAILADGSVVSWGQLDCGGDSSAAQALWVPRVAEAVEEMTRPLEPPPGCKEGWPWEVNLDLWSAPKSKPRASGTVGKGDGCCGAGDLGMRLGQNGWERALGSPRFALRRDVAALEAFQ
eukprot:s2213_g7.t1